MTWLKGKEGEKEKIVGLQVTYDSEEVRHFHKGCFSVVQKHFPDSYDSFVLTSNDIKDSPCACDHCGKEIEAE